MIRTVIAICLCCWIAACANPRADSCAASADAMLAMSFDDFDQGADGWRSLEASLACSHYADDVLAAYRSRHTSSLSRANASLLVWHEAQILAGQGDSGVAGSLMKEAASPVSRSGSGCIEKEVSPSWRATWLS